MQKGGTVGLLLVVFGILVVTMWGGYTMFKADPEEVRAPTPLVEVIPDGEKVRKTRSFVVLDNSFAYYGGHVYYRSGVDTSSGEPLYSVLPVSKPESFQKVGSATAPAGSARTSLFGGSGSTYAQSAYASQQYGMPVTSDQTQAQAGQVSVGGTTQLGSALGSGSQGYSVSYYTDGQNVYMIVESGGTTSAPQVVVGADPDTFQVLSAEYAKDADNVYVVIVTCIGDSCTATISIIASADPDTFQAFSNTQNVLTSDCSGYVAADGQDANHVYNNGQIVDGVSVYLIGAGGSCDNTPVLISP